MTLNGLTADAMDALKREAADAAYAKCEEIAREQDCLDGPDPWSRCAEHIADAIAALRLNGAAGETKKAEIERLRGLLERALEHIQAYGPTRDIEFDIEDELRKRHAEGGGP